MTSIISIIDNKTIIVITAFSTVLCGVYFFGHSFISFWYSSFECLYLYQVRQGDRMQLKRA